MNHADPVSLVAFGSNQGDRLASWNSAIDAIAQIPHVRNVLSSSTWETDPIGGQDKQSPYVNGAIRLSTSLGAVELFESLVEIERDLGRKRTGRWKSRTIDLDLLIHQQQAGRFAELVLPHPRMSFRRFVLQPAVEIAPTIVHPTTKLTLKKLLEILDRRDNLLALVAADLSRARKIAHELQAEFPEMEIVAQLENRNRADGSNRAADTHWRTWCGTMDQGSIAQVASVAKLVVVMDANRTFDQLCRLFSDNNRIAAPSLLLGSDFEHWTDEVSAAIAAATGRAQKL